MRLADKCQMKKTPFSTCKLRYLEHRWNANHKYKPQMVQASR
ncbi:hypothetical protein HMPREF9069_00306 [Atopobium sp. oral taxon 810 str. F0209]|nr:hypothetical protein HMPREF9069_00306 [Atopobium sp. oral taxon 810 str. F0209]